MASEFFKIGGFGVGWAVPTIFKNERTIVNPYAQLRSNPFIPTLLPAKPGQGATRAQPATLEN